MFAGLTEHVNVWSVQSVMRTVTWLILPVVICLSQRLSHACLSLNESKVKPRIAHYNSRRFFDLRSTWITVVILELIHAIEPRPYGTGAFIRTKPISRKAVVW